MTKLQADALTVSQYNYGKLHRLTNESKRPALTKYLTDYNGSLLNTLRSIIGFTTRHPPMIDCDHPGRKPVYVLTNDKLTAIRRKQTASTTNRHFNFLCIIGLLIKIPQAEFDDYVQANNNHTFKRWKEGRSAVPINVFTVPKWTPDYLAEVETKAAQLQAAGITTGTIRRTHLTAAGLTATADEIYYLNSHDAEERRAQEYEVIHDLIQDLVSDCGYCTKQQIIDNLSGMISAAEIATVITDYKVDLLQEFNYKTPTKEQRELYGIGSKWIYTKREAQKEKEIIKQ